MKISSHITALILTIMLSLNSVLAQTNNVSDCNNPHINTILVNTNSALETSGYKLITTKMITLYPKTITTQQLKLEAGKVYQLNFILPSNYKNVQITLINQNKEEVFKDKLRSKEGNKTVFNKSVTPTSSGNYWVVIDAVMNDKSLTCIGFSTLCLE